MTERSLPRPPGHLARRWVLVLEGTTAVGALAGVQGFLAGSFDPLVEQLAFVDGPVIPALALGVCIAVPHGVALVLGLRRHALAPSAALGAGCVLIAWMLAQLLLIGWGAPVQWAFFAVAVAEVAAASRWLHGSADRRPAAPTRQA